MTDSKKNASDPLQNSTNDDAPIVYRTPSSSTVSQRTLINARPSILHAPRKNRALSRIREYMRSPHSTRENYDLAKEVANYNLYSSYTFFGTLHIKTSAAMLTIFYILALAVFDFVADAVFPDSIINNWICPASTVIMLAVLVAQYGMKKESSLCLLPLMVTQMVVFAMMIFVLGYATLLEFYCVLSEICSSGRLLMLAMGSAVFCVLHCYCIVIMLRCWRYFRFTKKRIELEQAWHADIVDDEVVLFDKCAA